LAESTAKRKPGKTFEERFLAELERQSDAEHNPVKNAALREQLGWQDERFDKVRAALIKAGKIKAAPGQGGKTRFVSPPSKAAAPQKLKAFVSYSHADEGLKDEFIKHLHPLQRLGLIENWNDRKIKPGDEFDKTISNELDSADLVFILVSVDFINSKYCYDVELERAIERHKKNKSRVIPIILRSCLWEHSPFGGLLALPRDGKAVKTYPDQDAAFKEIAVAVHELALDLLQPA
jgi:TIR domain